MDTTCLVTFILLVLLVAVQAPPSIAETMNRVERPAGCPCKCFVKGSQRRRRRRAVRMCRKPTNSMCAVRKCTRQTRKGLRKGFECCDNIPDVCTTPCSLYERRVPGTCECVSCLQCDRRIRMRREYRSLPVAEREAFVRAIKSLEADGTFGMLSDIHAQDFSNIHGFGNFYPWHTGFLFLLESKIIDLEPDIKGLPYFNWGGEPFIAQSSMWLAQTLGGSAPGGGPIPDGPFEDFSVSGNTVTRNFQAGVETAKTPIIEGITANAANLPFWSDINSNSISNQLELLHNFLHLFVCGTMCGTNSPSDPVFYMHHAFNDKWWAQDWRIAAGIDINTSPQSLLEGLPLSRSYSNLGGFTLSNAVEIQACVKYVNSPPFIGPDSFASGPGSRLITLQSDRQRLKFPLPRKFSPGPFVDSSGRPVLKIPSLKKLSMIANARGATVQELRDLFVSISDSMDAAVAAGVIPSLNLLIEEGIVPNVTSRETPGPVAA